MLLKSGFNSVPIGYDGAGNIVSYTDSVMGGWGFGYDTLHRMTSGSASSGAYSGLQTSWGYDPFGNRQNETFSGSTQMPMPTSSTASYNGNNQISGSSLMLGAAVQYNASGDVTEDNQNQYLYNGDGQPCAVKNMVTGAMVGYIYGADGTRVSVGTITTWGSCDPSVNGYQAMKDSIAGPTGGQMTETGVDANGSVTWAHTNVWMNGNLLATYDTNGVHFYLNDWTGSRRVQTDYEGNLEQTCTNLPYGDGESCSATPTEELYAGLERDSESGLDHADYRQYSSTFGQWTAPDPYGDSYNWSNPQSLNRYAYVNGRPMRFTDPSGLYPCDPSTPTWSGDTLIVDCAAPYIAEATGINAIPYVGLAFDIGTFIYDIGKDFGWWGRKPQFKGNVKASQSGKNVPSHNTTGCKTGFGAGITIGADAGAGVGVTGAGANGSVGAALFGGNGVNAGVFASGGAGANFLGHTASAVTQLISANFFGAGGGVGGGIFLTNASQASQLAGPSATWNVDLGWVANGAGQFTQGADAAGNSIYTFSFTLGGGGGALYHNVTDTTVARGTGSGCE